MFNNEGETDSFLRKSPYVMANLLKFEPQLVLPTQNFRNELPIMSKNLNLSSYINYNNYE